MVVALLSEKAEIVYNPDETDMDVLEDEVKDLGFGVEILEDSEAQQGKLNVMVRERCTERMLPHDKMVLLTDWRNDLCFLCQ